MRAGEGRLRAAVAVTGSRLSGRLSQFVIGAGISALAIAVYWPIRGHEWLSWDDFIYITQNPHVAQGIGVDSVWWAVSDFYLANWFPGTWISWMLDYELHGFDAGAFLTTNLVLHAVNSVLLFAAQRRLTKSTYRSAFVAAVFAVHPLHVESVAWVSARKDVLSGVFWMLALWLHAGDGPAMRRRIGVAVCFALGHQKDTKSLQAGRITQAQASSQRLCPLSPESPSP